MHRNSRASVFLPFAGAIVCAAAVADASPMSLTININGDIRTFTETSPNQILLLSATFAGGVIVSGEIATSSTGPSTPSVRVR